MSGGTRPRVRGAKEDATAGPQGASDAHPLAGLLSRHLRLTNPERQAVEGVSVRLRDVPADRIIEREGDRSAQCVVVLDGLTCLSKVVGSGARQIVAFHLPGDAPDLHGLHLGHLDGDLWAVAPSTLAVMDPAQLRLLCERQPRIAAALWRVTLVDAAIQREWTVNLGQRLAVQRLAHLFCEVLLRMGAVGLAHGDACAFPVTQADLGEAIGLSSVHLNRSLQELRQEGLVSFERGSLIVHDRAALAERGDFDPAYLHLAGAGAVPRSPSPPA